jgi:hypothetical protein
MLQVFEPLFTQNARWSGAFNIFTLRLYYFPPSSYVLGRVSEFVSACAPDTPEQLRDQQVVIVGKQPLSG